jgi:hypothetical protein
LAFAYTLASFRASQRININFASTNILGECIGERAHDGTSRPLWCGAASGILHFANVDRLAANDHKPKGTSNIRRPNHRRLQLGGGVLILKEGVRCVSFGFRWCAKQRAPQCFESPGHQHRGFLKKTTFQSMCIACRHAESTANPVNGLSRGATTYSPRNCWPSTSYKSDTTGDGGTKEKPQRGYLLIPHLQVTTVICPGVSFKVLRNLP